MPTEEQLAANRANAARSTGPRTLEGKVRSAQNARKHGFAGADYAIVTIEDRAAVDRLRADLIAVYQPANAQELFAIERIALAQHGLLRLARLESGMGAVALNHALQNYADEAPFVPLHDELKCAPEDVKIQNRNYCLAHGFQRMVAGNSATWPLFLRYQAQTERQYRRAVEDWERLQRLRPHLPNQPISTPEVKEPTAPSPPPNEPNSEAPPEPLADVLVYGCTGISLGTNPGTRLHWGWLRGADSGPRRPRRAPHFPPVGRWVHSPGSGAAANPPPESSAYCNHRRPLRRPPR